MAGFNDRLAASVRRFKIVLPDVMRALRIDEVYSVESEQSRAASILDAYCGIDAYIIKHGKGVFGLASRMQGDDRDYLRSRRDRLEDIATFTIRTRIARTGNQTEYYKWYDSLKNHGYVSHYFLQAYFSDMVHEDELLGWAVCRTDDLLETVHAGERKELAARTTGDMFIPVKWREMRERGKWIIAKTA